MADAQAGYSLAFARNVVSAKMGPYAAALPPIYVRFSGHYVALGGPGRGVDRLCGDWGDLSLMLGQFPDYESVAGFWWSPEYRAAAALRVGAVDIDCCRLAGRPIPDSHEAVLVLVFRPADPVALQLLDASCRAAARGSLLAPLDPAAFEVLEGDLTGCSVRVLSFPDRAALDADWAAIGAALAGRGALQAYAAARYHRA